MRELADFMTFLSVVILVSSEVKVRLRCRFHGQETLTIWFKTHPRSNVPFYFLCHLECKMGCATYAEDSNMAIIFSCIL